MISKFTISVILYGFMVLSCKSDRDRKGRIGRADAIEDNSAAIDKRTSEDYNSIILKYEGFISSVWNEAKEAVQSKNKSFSVHARGKTVQFELSKSKDLTEYLVGGDIKGILSINYTNHGEISSAVFQPWDPSIRGIRTRIILESAEPEESRKIFTNE